jgi:hypothetical protein
MIKVKNVRPGILIIADTGLKLSPGEFVDVDNLTVQMQRCLNDGLLARIEVDTEEKTKSKTSSTRGSTARKSETSKSGKSEKTESANSESQTAVSEQNADGEQAATGQQSLIEAGDDNS